MHSLCIRVRKIRRRNDEEVCSSVSSMCVDVRGGRTGGANSAGRCIRCCLEQHFSECGARFLENVMPRFFRRFSKGVLDVEDLKSRTEGLAQFIDAAAERYGFNRKKLLSLVIPNGANIESSAAPVVFVHRPGCCPRASRFGHTNVCPVSVQWRSCSLDLLSQLNDVTT